MQTFLPYESFEQSARVLDRNRLGNQRIEARHILLINLGLNAPGRWKTHPAVLMWQGFDAALATYGICVCNEWRQRGYVDHQKGVFLGALLTLGRVRLPPWLGDPDLHRSHRANLLRKKPEHYSQFWDEDPSLPYVWPNRSQDVH